MLYMFLDEHSQEVIELTREKLRTLDPNIVWSPKFEGGVLKFFEHLKAILRKGAESDEYYSPLTTELETKVGGKMLEEVKAAAVEQGDRTNYDDYSIFNVVHGYGTICQTVTELAHKYHQPISSKEFHGLNFALDLVTAAAVSEFAQKSLDKSEAEHLLVMRSLSHELKSPLASAIMALDLISSGEVSLHGQVGDLLARSLQSMKSLIDAAMEEASTKSIELKLQPTKLRELVADVISSCKYRASSKNVALSLASVDDIEVMVDREHMFRVLLNLVENAIKFTKPSTEVTVRARRFGERMILEVEDRCGGLTGNPDDLFRPYVQKSKDQSGIGLGLAIAKKMVAAHNGRLLARNVASEGCVFTVEL